jgi:hypothetical protein
LLGGDNVPVFLPNIHKFAVVVNRLENRSIR